MDEENNLQRSQDRESDSGENCSKGLLNETMELSSTTALEETIYDGQEEAIMEIEEDANMADEEKNQESNDSGLEIHEVLLWVFAHLFLVSTVQGT